MIKKVAVRRNGSPSGPLSLDNGPNPAPAEGRLSHSVAVRSLPRGSQAASPNAATRNSKDPSKEEFQGMLIHGDPPPHARAPLKCGAGCSHRFSDKQLVLKSRSKLGSCGPMWGGGQASGGLEQLPAALRQALTVPRGHAVPEAKLRHHPCGATREEAAGAEGPLCSPRNTRPPPRSTSACPREPQASLCDPRCPILLLTTGKLSGEAHQTALLPHEASRAPWSPSDGGHQPRGPQASCPPGCRGAPWGPREKHVLRLWITA